MTHENADIAADLTLVDKYLTNLVNFGASSDTTLTASTCNNYGGNYGGDDSWGGDYYGNDYQAGGCYSASRGGTTGTFALIGLAALWNKRRRRSVRGA